MSEDKDDKFALVRPHILKSFHDFYASFPNAPETMQRIVQWFNQYSKRELDTELSRILCEANICFILGPTPLACSIPQTWQQHGWMPRAWIFVSTLYQYDRMIKLYHKTIFDIFRRNTRLMWKQNDGEVLETSYCQFNYFKWICEFQLLEHLQRFATVKTGTKRISTESGKNYYMRHREEEHNQAIWFCCPTIVESVLSSAIATVEPATVDAMVPAYEQPEWEQQALNELLFSSRVELLPIQTVDLSHLCMCYTAEPT